MTIWRPAYPGVITESHKLENISPSGTLSVCGRTAKSMRAEIFGSESFLQSSWARKMCDAVDFNQEISYADLTGPETAQHPDELELTAPDGYCVNINILSACICWHILMIRRAGEAEL